MAEIKTGIYELDLHGMRGEEAIRKINSTIDSCGKSVYRIRLIHGFNHGTSMKAMIQEEYNYGRNHRVLRVIPGNNQGITELVLREY